MTTELLQQSASGVAPVDDGVARLAGYALFALLFVVCIGLGLGLPASSNGVADASGGDGDLLRQLTYALLFGATMLVTWRTGWLRSMPVAMLLVFAWCWFSVLWAIEPGIALRRVLLMSFIAAIIFSAVEATGTERALKVVAALLVVALLINYAAVLLNPMAIHQAGESTDPALVGNWRGATNHKNYVGAVCAVTVMVLLLGPRVLRPPLNWLAIAAAGYFLWRTQSKTSMAMLLLALGCAAIFLVSSPRGRRLILPGLAAALLVVLLTFGTDIFDRISEFLSQPAALTGRTDIWAALFAYSREHIWLGSGFGSFWGIGDRSPILLVAHEWATEIATGHNGYLDLLVQIGLPGLLLTLFAMVVMPLWRVTHVERARPQSGALLVALLVFAIGHNVTESSLLSRDLPVGVVLLLAVALTAKFAREGAGR